MNFYQFYDKLHGNKPYEGLPTDECPVFPRFMDYLKLITNGSKVMTADQGDWTFKDITDEDTARYGAYDVMKNQEEMAHYHKLNQQRHAAVARQAGGKMKFFSPTVNLGEPMSDQEYRDFMGITW